MRTATPRCSAKDSFVIRKACRKASALLPFHEATTTIGQSLWLVLVAPRLRCSCTGFAWSNQGVVCLIVGVDTQPMKVTCPTQDFQPEFVARERRSPLPEVVAQGRVFLRRRNNHVPWSTQACRLGVAVAQLARSSAQPRADVRARGRMASAYREPVLRSRSEIGGRPRSAPRATADRSLRRCSWSPRLVDLGQLVLALAEGLPT